MHVCFWQGAWLIAAGGVTYTVGGTIYALRWPNPWPRTFGYHEIFHAATILASIFHFTAVRQSSLCTDALAAYCDTYLCLLPIAVSDMCLSTLKV